MKRPSRISLPFWLARSIYGHARMGFRGYNVKGASVYDMAVRLGMHDRSFVQAGLALMREDPDIRRAIDERWLAPLPDVPALLELPEGTLGRTYAQMITESGYDPQFYAIMPHDDDMGYVGMRLRQIHDILHVVTGFDTDFCGEAGLVSCTAAQLHDGLSLLVLGALQIRTTILEPTLMPRLMAHIACGHEMGLRARPFLAQKFELGWERPVEDWRRELGIVPPPAWLRPHLDGTAASPA